MNIQEREEAEFGQGPRLWDAGEGVCCAEFQTGACRHTESFDYEDDNGAAEVAPDQGTRPVLPDTFIGMVGR